MGGDVIHIYDRILITFNKGWKPECWSNSSKGNKNNVYYWMTFNKFILQRVSAFMIENGPN